MPEPETLTLEQFQQADPTHLQGLLLALWHARRGNWDQAHQIAQDLDTPDAAWVHAFLHRQEGDTSNAAYWYRRGQRPAATTDLAQEWETIVRHLLRPRLP